MLKIGIIINPYSKKIVRMKSDPVEFYKKIGGDSVEIRLTRNEDDIVKAAKDFKKLSISYLAISGGDGSVHLVISKFLSVYKKNLPHILLLKDGSMNLVSKSLNLKGKGPDILNRLLNTIKNGGQVDIAYRNTIKVNDMYCFLFGLGFVSNYINEFNKGGNKSPLKAFKVMAIAIWQALFKTEEKGLFSRMNLKLIVDGKALAISDYFAVFAATIANLAISFTPTPRAYEKENTFHLIATGLKPGALIKNLNKIRRGVRINHPDHYDNIASDIKIIRKGKFLYQMDGDIYETSGSLHAKKGLRIGFVRV